MNSEIQVVLTGNAADLQDTLDTTTGSLDALGATADKTAAQVAGSSGATDEAAASTTALGDSAEVTTGRLAEAGGAADAAAADVDVASDAAKGGAFSFGALGDTIKSTILPLLAMFVAYEGIKDTIKDTAATTDQYQASEAQINQTLKNTNDAIGLNISQINKLADATSKNTVISTNQNLAVEQTLLGYSAINKQALPQSISLVDDLATRMAKGATPSTQQLNTASKALGKALEDPATGMTAFTRATVTFTPAQVAAVKAMEAAGNTAGAQALEMKDLSSVVGGDASAATETFSGKVTELKNSLEPLELKLGTDVHNALLKLGQDFVNDLPTIEKVAEALGKVLLPILKFLWSAIGDIVTVLGLLFETIGGGDPTLQKNQERFAGIASFLANDFEPALKDVVTFFELLWQTLDGGDVTIKGSQAQFAGIAKALVAIRTAVIDVANVIKTILIAVWNALKIAIDGLMPSIKALINTLISSLKPVFDDIYQAVDRLWNALNPALTDALKVVAVVVGAVLYVAIYLLINALRLAIDVIVIMVAALTDVIKWIADFIGWIGTGISWTIKFGEAMGTAVGEVISWFGKLPGIILSAVGKFGTLLYQAGKDLIQGLINGIKSAVGDVTKAVGDVGKDAVNAAKSVLKIFSPSQVFADIGANVGAGLVQGIQGTQQAVSSASGQLATKAITGATNLPPSTASANTGGVNSSNNGNNNQPITIQGGTFQFMTASAVQQFFNMNRDSILASKGLSLTQGNVPAGSGVTSS